MTLPTIPTTKVLVTLGVDTHSNTHVCAALEQFGRCLGTLSVPATATGYARLMSWASEFGTLKCVGVEGMGSYGAGLARFLTAVCTVIDPAASSVMLLTEKVSWSSDTVPMV